MGVDFIIDIPSEVLYIIELLQENSFEAYIVGGCLRDCIMSNTPKDWDVATSALPEEIKECFKEQRVIETGIAHGTITVVVNSFTVEVTTYRVDGVYSDNRHPDRVDFTKSITEDLSRRDFTINALAYNPSTGLVDPFNGIKDIKDNIIRCVGNTNQRLKEDSLRILRALRFASILSFLIEENTSKAILSNKELLQNISKERISKELIGIVTGYSVKQILMEYKDIILEIIPELQYLYSNSEILKTTLNRIIVTPSDGIMRYAVLFTTIATNNLSEVVNEEELKKIKDILKGFKYSNDFIKAVLLLIEYSDINISLDRTQIKKYLSFLGVERFKQLVQIRRAWQLTDTKGDTVFIYDEIIQLIDEIEEGKECYSLERLAVNGNDLLELGFARGNKIGEILNQLLDMVIEERIVNEKEVLLEHLQKLSKKSE